MMGGQRIGEEGEVVEEEESEGEGGRKGWMRGSGGYEGIWWERNERGVEEMKE